MQSEEDVTVLPLEPRECPAVATHAAGLLTLPSGVQVEALGGFAGPGDVATDGTLTAVGAGVGGGPAVQVYDAGGRIRASFFAFDEGFRGGVQVGIDAAGVRVVPAPGSGGGPVLRTFDAGGNLLSSVWVGDPADRGGVYLAAGESAARVTARTGVPADLSRLGVRLIAGPEPTDQQWDTLRADLSRLSPALVRDLIRSGVTVDVVTGPLTQHPAVPADYATDFGGAFAGNFAAVVDPTRAAGSVSTVLHEVGHGADLRVLGEVSADPEWLAVHGSTPWPTDHERGDPRESWAESFARHVLGRPQPSAAAGAYFAARFAGRGW